MNHSKNTTTGPSMDPKGTGGVTTRAMGRAVPSRPLLLVALFALAASCGSGSDTPTNNPGGTAQPAVWDASDWDQSDWQ